MTEHIGVTYRSIGVGPIPTGGYHMAIFYTNNEGQTKVIEVGPSIDPPGVSPLTNAVVHEHYFSNSNTDSPFGKIAGGERPWTKSDELLPQSVLTNGDDLSLKWNSIKSTLNDGMSKGYEYQGPFDQNSNTFVRDAVRNAGIPVPDGIATDINGDIAAYWSPGANNLSKPINQSQSTQEPAGFSLTLRRTHRRRCQRPGAAACSAC